MTKRLQNDHGWWMKGKMKNNVITVYQLNLRRGHDTKRHCALCGAPLHRWRGKGRMKPNGKALCNHCSAKANGLASKKEAKINE
jgi:uncharacterized Zn finger protein (UPF0148 family)